MTRGRRPEHSREKILEKGAELFTRNGYNATGLKEILEACEVSKGSFYNFFANKEQFALEILQHYQSIESGRWAEQVAALEGSHLSKIEWMLGQAINDYEADSERVGCLLANLTGEVCRASPLFGDAIRSSVEAIIVSIESDIRICQAEGSVRTDFSARQIAEAVWDHWQGALLRVKTEQSTAPLRNHLQTLLKLIKTPDFKG